MKNRNVDIGNAFERWFVNFLRGNGYVAYLFPKVGGNGGQPFDIHAVRPDRSLYVDCKVCSSKGKAFGLDRIEANQWMNFEELDKVGKVQQSDESGLGLIRTGFVIADMRKADNPFDFSIDKVLFLPFWRVQWFEKMRLADDLSVRDRGLMDFALPGWCLQ